MWSGILDSNLVWQIQYYEGQQHKRGPVIWCSGYQWERWHRRSSSHTQGCWGVEHTHALGEGRSVSKNTAVCHKIHYNYAVAGKHILMWLYTQIRIQLLVSVELLEVCLRQCTCYNLWKVHPYKMISVFQAEQVTNTVGQCLSSKDTAYTLEMLVEIDRSRLNADCSKLCSIVTVFQFPYFRDCKHMQL